MESKKVYLILYYICFLITFLLQYFVVGTAEKIADSYISGFQGIGFLSFLTFDIIFIAVMSILFIKLDMKKPSILFPIIYIIFFALVCILVTIYFSNLIYPSYVLYYYIIILFGYLFLNIYTVLCLTRKDKKISK